MTALPAVACGAQDIGTGTYTVLALLTSEKTGVAVEKVEVVLGDTELRLARSQVVHGRLHLSFLPSLPQRITPINSLLAGRDWNAWIAIRKIASR